MWIAKIVPGGEDHKYPKDGILNAFNVDLSSINLKQMRVGQSNNWMERIYMGLRSESTTVMYVSL